MRDEVAPARDAARETARSRTGDSPREAAFARLVREHKDMVFALSLAHTRDRALAEDVSQEVFMKAFRTMNEAREPDRIKAWLCSVTRNTAIDHIRKRAHAPASLDRDGADPTAPVSENVPDDRLARLKAEIGALPEDYREILALRYVKEMSYRDIGKALGMTVSAVGEKLCRIRKAIQLKLQSV